MYFMNIFDENIFIVMFLFVDAPVIDNKSKSKVIYLFHLFWNLTSA